MQRPVQQPMVAAARAGSRRFSAASLPRWRGSGGEAGVSPHADGAPVRACVCVCVSPAFCCSPSFVEGVSPRRREGARPRGEEPAAAGALPGTARVWLWGRGRGRGWACAGRGWAEATRAGGGGLAGGVGVPRVGVLVRAGEPGAVVGVRGRGAGAAAGSSFAEILEAPRAGGAGRGLCG